MTRKKTFAIFVPIVIVMVLIDRVTKGWAATHLRMGVTGPDFGIVDLELVHNYGAAFGMGQGSGIVFIVVAVAICLAAIAWLAFVKKHRVIEVIALSLVVAGGIGNLIDRLTNVYVIDFLHFTFIDFPVFNVADICVTCGVVLFLLTLIFTGAFSDDKEAEEV